MGKRVLTFSGLAIALIALLALNILSERVLRGARIDLTDQSLFTLSHGTRKILNELQEPVTLRFYLSDKLATRLPGISSYSTRVRELLDEYERLSDGKLRILIVDPEPFSEEEDRAVAYGISGVPVGGYGEIFYFGLVGTSSTDDQEVIPYFTQERETFLEYDVTRLVYALSQPELKVVGLLSSIPLQSLPQQQGGVPTPWMIMEQISQLFDIHTIAKDVVKIPDDVDVLMIVHPKDLSDQTLYAVDQYILSGGTALVFIDPFAGSDRSQMTGGASSSNMSALLGQWGLEMQMDVVVSDMDAAAQVQIQRDGRMVVIDYPVWMSLDPQYFNPLDIVTADIGPLNLASAGALLLRVDKTTNLVPLVQSSSNADFASVELLNVFANPEDLMREFDATGEPFVLAARITGDANTAFPAGRPLLQDEELSAELDAADLADHLQKSAGSINVIVVADSDLLRDRFWVQVRQFMGSRVAIPTAANNAFVINALDNLTGSGDLIGIRNRGTFTRPFERIDSIRQVAEVEFRDKEQQLIVRLESTEAMLLELESGKRADETYIVNDKQQVEIDKFQQERLKIRKELRQVRHELRKNIESLEGRIKVINIAVVPVLILVFGLLVGGFRRGRYRSIVR